MKEIIEYGGKKILIILDEPWEKCNFVNILFWNNELYYIKIFKKSGKIVLVINEKYSFELTSISRDYIYEIICNLIDVINSDNIQYIKQNDNEIDKLENFVYNKLHRFYIIRTLVSSDIIYSPEKPLGKIEVIFHEEPDIAPEICIAIDATYAINEFKNSNISRKYLINHNYIKFVRRNLYGEGREWAYEFYIRPHNIESFLNKIFYEFIPNKIGFKRNKKT